MSLIWPKLPAELRQTGRQTADCVADVSCLAQSRGLQVSTWRPTTTRDIAAVLSHGTHQHVTLIMRKRELFRHAPSFLPAKKHSVLSCSVSLAHPFEFFNFFLPYYHYIQILSPCLALTEQRVRQGSIYAVFEVELRVWHWAQSICLTGQEVCDCCQSFLGMESVTSVRGREAQKHTEPIRL